MQLSSAQLRNDLIPITDGWLGDTQGPSYGSAGLEESDDVFLEHAPMLGITYRLVKDDLSSDSYADRMETMGDRIRMLRQSRGWTQEELGRRVGVHKVSVSQWETGSTANIKLQTVLALIEELGTTLEYLVHGPEQKGTAKGRRQV